MSASALDARPASAARLNGVMDVLIADDNVASATALAQNLQAAGYTVRIVADGDAAIDAVLAEPPDAAFLDIGMPGRDGWEAARTIRRALAGRPCLMVAVTGFNDEIDRDRSLEAGFDLHLAKPVDSSVLIDLLREHSGDATEVILDSESHSDPD
jgi:CheY-like chemotaxis protein